MLDKFRMKNKSIKKGLIVKIIETNIQQPDFKKNSRKKIIISKRSTNAEQSKS